MKDRYSKPAARVLIKKRLQQYFATAPTKLDLFEHPWRAQSPSKDNTPPARGRVIDYLTRNYTRATHKNIWQDSWLMFTHSSMGIKLVTLRLYKWVRFYFQQLKRRYAQLVLKRRFITYYQSLNSHNLVVGLYYPHRLEVDVRPMAKWLSLRSGAKVVLPRTLKASGKLEFVPWKYGDKLTPGPYGILEPSEEIAPLSSDRSDENIEGVVPHLIVLPLLGFNARGFRLGYGGGYYDRTLSAPPFKHTVLVGLGFSWQEIDFQEDSWDVPLKDIITEKARITN